MHVPTNWKFNLLAGGIVLAAVTAPALAQVQVYIGRTPPPIRYETRPPMPGEGYVWTEGYWAPDRGRYVWRPGVWQRSPYAGAYWSHPHYDHYQQGWQMHEGHWDRDDHGNGRDNRDNGNRDNNRDQPHR